VQCIKGCLIKEWLQQVVGLMGSFLLLPINDNEEYFDNKASLA